MNRTNDTLLKAFPTEIICRIFELSITTSCAVLQPESADAWYSNLKASSQFSPFHLGAISKAWRNIVWSTPQLWSTIVIKLDSKVFVTSAGYEMVEGWFQRSGCLPLGIRIYEHDPTAGLGHRGYFMNQFMSTRYPGYRRADSGVRLPTLEQKSRVLDLVNSYSRRWRVLDVHLPRELQRSRTTLAIESNSMSYGYTNWVCPRSSNLVATHSHTSPSYFPNSTSRAFSGS